LVLQHTLIIVKPDGLAKKLVGKILYSLQTHDLHVKRHVVVQLNEKFVKKFYASESCHDYFPDIVRWITSAPVLLLEVGGKEAIALVKQQIIGKYPDGLRGQYAENHIKNVAHASDSVISATRELRLVKSFFERGNCMGQARFEGKMIFALTGMSECGKSTVGRYLDLKGIKRLKIVRLFEQVRDKLSPGEKLGDFIQQEEAKDPYTLWNAFVDELLSTIKFLGTDMASIESLYGGGLGPYLIQKLGDHFCIIYIDIPLELRLSRQMERENLNSIEEARKLLLPRDEVKTLSGIPKLKEIACEVIDNSSTFEDLYQNIDAIIKKYKK